MKKLTFLFLLLFIPFLSLQAQFGSATGGHPNWIKWHQIDTDTIRLIYPEGMEAYAQRAVGMMQYMAANNKESIGERTKKFTILFRNQTVVPNGFVGPNPYRSEFFTTPVLSRLSPMDWVDLLTIHEYRHVMQTHTSDVGLTRLVHVLSGEATWSGMAYLAVPIWFDEGDATIQETALSPSGRGRVPKFFASFKALSLENKRYSYEKLRNGSLKNIVPNHYPLGYLMGTYIRNKYGNNAWRSIYDDAVRYKGIFYPFSKSLKRKTGMGTPQLYDTVMNHMDSIWRKPNNTITRRSGTEKISKAPKKNTPTFYSFPQALSENTYIVSKRSYKERNALYEITAPDLAKAQKAIGKEKKLVQMGITFDNNFSYKNGTAVWSELAYHPRWDFANYYVIKSFNVATKEKRTITKKTKYVGPDLTNDRKKLVAVNVNDQRQYQLHILNAFNGEVLSKIPDKGGIFWAYPKWTTDDQSIIAVATKNHKNAIVKIDPNSGKMTELVSYTSNLIEHPFVAKDYVYFTSSFEGTDNIFAVSLNGGAVQQVTNALVKASTAGLSEDDQHLIYTEQTSNGNELHRIRLSPNDWKTIRIIEPVDQENIINSVAEAEGGNILDRDFNNDYPTKKYSKFDHLIRPHSWTFLPEHPVYSFKLNSTNFLETFNLALGPEYNYNENSFSFVTQATFAQFYPIFDILHNSSFKRGGLFIERDLEVADSLVIANRTWNENAFVSSATIPFNLSAGNYSTQLNFGLRYSHRRLNFDAKEDYLNRPNGQFNTLGFQLQFFNQELRATQDVATRFGQTLTMGFRQTIEEDAGKIFFARGTLFFPGLARTHSFSVNYGYQKQLAFNEYKFSNQFIVPRGFGGNIFTNDQLYKVGFNYHFPVWYPDLQISSLLFVKRFRANIFFDHGLSRLTEVVRDPINHTYQSVGIELSGDIGFLRSFELPMGIQISYLVNKPDFVEKTINIGFILR